VGRRKREEIKGKEQKSVKTTKGNEREICVGISNQFRIKNISQYFKVFCNPNTMLWMPFHGLSHTVIISTE
jgi:hypothetical protein